MLAKRAFTQAGLPCATFRTTCATMLVQQGKPINVAAAYLGDSVPTFLASYVSHKLSPATMATELASARTSMLDISTFEPLPQQAKVWR
jgi:integrase